MQIILNLKPLKQTYITSTQTIPTLSHVKQYLHITKQQPEQLCNDMTATIKNIDIQQPDHLIHLEYDHIPLDAYNVPALYVDVDFQSGLLGGKGGYGRKLRQQQNDTKITNFSSTRDLATGKRMWEVNEEREMAEWEANRYKREEEENKKRNEKRAAFEEKVEEKFNTQKFDSVISSVKKVAVKVNVGPVVEKVVKKKALSRYEISESSESSEDESEDESSEKEGNGETSAVESVSVSVHEETSTSEAVAEPPSVDSLSDTEPKSLKRKRDSTTLKGDKALGKEVKRAKTN